MPYLIDGHNLIPKAGLHLDSLDDEMELIGVLQEYSRLERKQVEVYFDGAPAPQAGTRKFGAVTAHFVLRGATADEAIRQRLKKLGKAARNWTVVTSDREVQAEARAFHAEVISSDSFAKSLRQTPSPGARSKPERNMSDNEVEEWLNLFEKRTKRS
jgi:predicted RNA-binding protein with PIN domain